MKKLMFLLPFAALAMASCSSSEDAAQSPVAQNNEVKLFPQVGGTTRGVVETTASIDEFNVVVSGSFATAATGVDPTLSSWEETATKAAGSWGLSTPLWWGDATTSASFMAYANEGGATYSAGKLTGFTANVDVAAQTDLVVAYNSGTKTDFASGVPLHFQHALSQVLVKANYVYDSEITNPDLVIKVKGIAFQNVNPTGTLTLPTTSTASSYTADWALTGTATSLFESKLSSPVTLSSTAVAIDNSATAGPLLLIPQALAATTDLTAATVTGSYMLVLVDIDYKEAQNNEQNNAEYDLFPGRQDGATTAQTEGEGNFAWVAIPVNINWTAGYKYTYTLNFTNYAVGRTSPVQPEDPSVPEEPELPDPDDPIVDELLTPLTFTVTVEDTWQEANSNISPM